jgi:hypothetical protein
VKASSPDAQSFGKGHDNYNGISMREREKERERPRDSVGKNLRYLRYLSVRNLNPFPPVENNV